MASTEGQAQALGERLLGAGLADDVLCFSRAGWLRRFGGQDPYWRGICREAIRLTAEPPP